MGMNDSLSDEDRAEFLKMVAEQRSADFEAVDPALTDRGALLGWDEDSNPVGVELGQF